MDKNEMVLVKNRTKYHQSVLLQETIQALQIAEGKKYIDATFGGGGHTQAILEKGGIVMGIDCDEDAVKHAKKQQHLTVVRGNFSDMTVLAHQSGFTSVSGILFDLGVSSHQFDTPERGFSFREDAPLDMRMDQRLGVKAKDLVNVLTKKELMELFIRFGEEQFAQRIALGIVAFRKVKPIETTKQLADIAWKAYPRGVKKIHPATKIFQALRIVVNDEMESLSKALPNAYALVQKRGRIAVISFHSLEDRIVKRIFHDWQEQGLGVVMTKKPILPTENEQQENPRSRSAKLRVFELL